MMEKFNSKKNINCIKKFPFSFFSHPAYLDCLSYVIVKNNECIPLTRDIYEPHKYPALFMPNLKINRMKCSVTFASEEDILKLKRDNIAIKSIKKSEIEYFYNTESIVCLKDKKIKYNVTKFKRLFEYKVKCSYKRAKISDFYLKWKKQKERSGFVFRDQELFFYFLLDNLDRYKIKQVYIEIDNKLVGLAWGALHPKDTGWVGMKLMSNYAYRGLSWVLHWERAKIFSNYSIFTLGTGCKEVGISRFKEELCPIMKKQCYFIITGE